MLKLKLGSLMVKCPLITVSDGWFQASLGSAVFLEYVPKFQKYSFAVDAKAFINSLKVLDDFVVVVKDEVLLADQKQEVKLTRQEPDIRIHQPTVNWHAYDLAFDWDLISNFVDTSYPGVRCTESYLEAFSSESITRMSTTLEIDEPTIFATCKLPKKSTGYNITNQLLWIAYSESCFVGLSKLDISIPNTDFLFNCRFETTVIPGLELQLTPAETAEFTEDGLFLQTKGIASTHIEGVQGKGKYAYNLFAKVIKYGLLWAMNNPKILYFAGPRIKGVIENQNA